MVKRTLSEVMSSVLDGRDKPKFWLRERKEIREEEN